MTQPLQVRQGAFLDFSGRTTLRVTGNDRLRFLNGQITNDVRKAGEAVAVEACLLNAKGKINAHIFVSAAPECFWIDADPELREALPARLERYVIADDVHTVAGLGDVDRRLRVDALDPEAEIAIFDRE